jgi:hypothetical protein
LSVSSVSVATVNNVRNNMMKFIMEVM